MNQELPKMRVDRFTWTIGAGLFGVMIITMVLSLTIGRFPVPPAEIVRVLTTTPLFGGRGSFSDVDWVVVDIVRLPRVLLVALCGMSLGLCGSVMQGVCRNPLMAPETAGVAPGAAFGGVLAIFLGLSSYGSIGMAFIFGLCALAFTFLLAKLGGKSGSLAIVLSGMIVGLFFGALTGVVEYVANPSTQLASIVFWLFGSFAQTSYDRVQLMAAILLPAGGALLLLRWRINLLSLGEIDARSLGVNVGLLRWMCVVLTALIVAAQISVGGQIGWVGLVTPHLARMLVGPNHARLLPASAFMGGTYLLVMDDIARTALPQEIPIGLLSALLGAPVFAYLFWKLGNRGWARE